MPYTPRRLVHNWRLKLAAFGLSVFLWALVQSEPRSQEVFTGVPVYVDVLDTTWTTSGGASPPTVELRLGGPAGEIIRLAREGPSIRVPIREIGSPDTLVTLRREWVRLGERSGVTVESINPTSVRVGLEPAVTRVVSVSPRLLGSLPDHLALAQPISLNPERVRVHGPGSRVSELEVIRLEAFDLSDVREPGFFTVPVDTSGLAGGWVVPGTAALGIEVEPEVERTLGGLAVTLPGGDATALDVIPNLVQVRLSGARSLVTGVRASTLRVTVAPELLQDLAPGGERKVRLSVEGGPSLVRAEALPDMVTVRRPPDGRGGGAPAPQAWVAPRTAEGVVW